MAAIILQVILGEKKYCRFIKTYLLAQEYYSWKIYPLDIKTHTWRCTECGDRRGGSLGDSGTGVWGGIGVRVGINWGNLSRGSLCTRYPAEDLGRWPRALGKNNKSKKNVWGTILFVVKQKNPPRHEWIHEHRGILYFRSRAPSLLSPEVSIALSTRDASERFPHREHRLPQAGSICTIIGKCCIDSGFTPWKPVVNCDQHIAATRGRKGEQALSAEAPKDLLTPHTRKYTNTD